MSGFLLGLQWSGWLAVFGGVYMMMYIVSIVRKKYYPLVPKGYERTVQVIPPSLINGSRVLTFGSASSRGRVGKGGRDGGGLDQDGRDRDGRDPDGRDRDGRDPDGRDEEGLDSQGRLRNRFDLQASKLGPVGRTLSRRMMYIESQRLHCSGSFNSTVTPMVQPLSEMGKRVGGGLQNLLTTCPQKTASEV